MKKPFPFFVKREVEKLERGGELICHVLYVHCFADSLTNKRSKAVLTVAIGSHTRETRQGLRNFANELNEVWAKRYGRV